MKFAALIRGTLYALAGTQVMGLNHSSGNHEPGGISDRTEQFRSAGLPKRASHQQQRSSENSQKRDP